MSETEIYVGVITPVEKTEVVAEPVQKTEIQKRIESFLSETRVPRIEGWTTIEKALAMAALVVRERPSLIVQIGVFGGASLIPQALALQQNGHGVIIGIDPWTKSAALEGDVGQDNADWWAKCDLDAIATGAWAAIDAEGVRDRAVLVRTQAHIISGLFPPNSIDILEIDGNHSELASCRDVNLFLPLVRPGGYVWFDDIFWNSTQNALRLMREQCNQIFEINNCALFLKSSPPDLRKLVVDKLYELKRLSYPIDNSEFHKVHDEIYELLKKI